MKGRVVELTFRVPPDYADKHADYEDLDYYVEHKVQIMGIPHPAYVFRMPEAYPDLHAGLEQFVKLIGGDRPPDVEGDKNHTVVYTAACWARWSTVSSSEPMTSWDFEVDGDLPIAWDAEWHGRHPGESGSYLRTIQFAAGRDYAKAPKRATCVILTEQGGAGTAGSIPARRSRSAPPSDRGPA